MTLNMAVVASEANSYSSWNFGLNQQVLLVPEADMGAQIVINSRDAMEHPWHLQSVNLFHCILAFPVPAFVRSFRSFSEEISCSLRQSEQRK
jgi:hypothetical protein